MYEKLKILKVFVCFSINLRKGNLVLGLSLIDLMPFVLSLQSVDKFYFFALRKITKKISPSLPTQTQVFAMQTKIMPQKLAIQKPN